ncbi:Zn(2)-C6 fungal-type domain-containing protein [Fusarium sp. LHS14.1]|nr:Zn(2)-C6 fungal-type domain-containing protein [Fusarium sp. LHS14.1]
MAGQKYVKSACLNCRRRKVKCDGNHVCSNCVTSNLECFYNVDGDLRRLSTKKTIVSLEERIGQLEGVLREHNIDQPQTTPTSAIETTFLPKQTSSTSGAQHRVSGGQGRNDDRKDDDDGLPQDPNSPSVLLERTPMQGLVDTASHDPIKDSEAFHAAQSDRAPASITSNHSDHFVLIDTPGSAHALRGNTLYSSKPDSEDEDDSITGVLSARMGALRLVEDGQLRYYGPTSNLHMYTDGLQSLSTPSFRSVATEGIGVLRRLGLNQEVPLALETHLAKLYFTWEDPAIHVVDQETFFAEKRRCLLHDTGSPYYSETLNNAICAMGASLAAGEDLHLPEPASEFFSSRAKALLDVEMDSPTVATVQALVIMSATEAASTRDARGWLYSGMATRLSADLGLHLDITKHMHNGLLTSRDMEIRQTAFWGVFIHEHMWNLYAGRPWGLGIQNITIPKPEAESEDGECKVWKSYPGTSWQPCGLEAGVPFPIRACTAANATLCGFMRQINTTLYAGETVDLGALVEFLIKTKKEMMEWHASLSPLLGITDMGSGRVYHPAILQLHMQYYATLIFLYRPYLSCRLVSQIALQDTPETRAAMESVPSDCVAAAHQVADILRCYQKQHSLRRGNVQIVHIILTASLTFIHDVCTRSYSESRHSLSDLQLCCHSLGEIGRCFGNATRALEVIILVKSEWQRIATARGSQKAGRKRPSFSMSGSPGELDGDYRPRRRHRASIIDTDRFQAPGFSMSPLLFDEGTLDLEGVNIGKPNLDEQGREMWLFSGEPSFDMNEMIPPIDWFNNQLLEGTHIPAQEALPGAHAETHVIPDEPRVGTSDGV